MGQDASPHPAPGSEAIIERFPLPGHGIQVHNMSLMRLFKSDPMNLVGPDVESAPVHRIDLSGNILSFSCPDQTAQITGFTGIRNFDIDTDPVVEVHNKDEASKLIFTSGWEFTDRIFAGTGFGDITLDIVLLKYLKPATPSSSLLNLEQFKKWTYFTTDKIYGRMNREMLEYPEKYATRIRIISA